MNRRFEPLTPRHRAEEFRRFLDLIEESVVADLDVHLVLDNCSTHKTPPTRRWLVRTRAHYRGINASGH